jgi:hypothetical protein
MNPLNKFSRKLIIILFFVSTHCFAENTNNSYSVAILPFAADQNEFADLGQDLQTLLSAHLSSNPNLIMVERAEIDKALSEVEMGLSGTVDPNSAAKIGYITGAQVLITGRAFAVRKDLIIVAKVIGVETSRVYGATVSMPLRGSIVDASTELSDKLSTTLAQQGNTLIAQIELKEDIVTRLSKLVKGKTLPRVSVHITEMSLNRNVLDPAAETEISYILQKLGFEIIDSEASNEPADIEISGEAFSEFGMRKGHLVSTKGRVELKAIRREDGKVLLVDRETAVAIDLSPEIAGKNALAKSAKLLTERLVPAIITSN